jgi:L-aminoadipate-semialdehyde dehydrogenase
MNTRKGTSADEARHALSLTERDVAELWSEVLPMVETLRATDNFFALGGDSMAMVMVEYRIKEEFSVELPPGVMLRAPTLRELSTLVDAMRTSSGEPNIAPSKPKDS